MTEPQEPADRRDEADDYEMRARLDAAREVERLVAANAASNATMSRLVDKVRNDAEKRERKIELLENESRQIRRLLIMVGVAIVLLLVVGAFNAYNTSQARHNAQQTATAAKSAASTNELLLGCFDVNSRCSKANAEAQSILLDEIKRYELVLVFCTRSTAPPTADPGSAKFLACVKRLYPNGPPLGQK